MSITGRVRRAVLPAAAVVGALYLIPLAEHWLGMRIDARSTVPLILMLLRALSVAVSSGLVTWAFLVAARAPGAWKTGLPLLLVVVGVAAWTLAFVSGGASLRPSGASIVDYLGIFVGAALVWTTLGTGAGNAVSRSGGPVEVVRPPAP